MRPSRRSSADDLFIVPLVVLLANLKVGLRMLADGTHVGSLGANHQMTAVAALPHGDAALLKDSLGLHILQQCAVTLFVGLLDSSNPTELLGKIVEAFLVSFLRHSVIHIRPLGILALGSMEQILGGIAQLAQSLEPQLCVLFFVFRGLEEQGGNLLIARLLCNRGKVGVLIPCLRFTDIL